MKLAAFLSLTLSMVFIYFLALHPAYHMHLYPDVFVFYDRAKYFWEHGNLTFLGHNEYQPGALLFFIMLSPILGIENSLDSFKTALFMANFLLIFSLGFVYFKMNKTSGIFILALLIGLLGPILLFRFDLLVIFLIVLSFYLWETKRKLFTVIILAFATIVKVYPIIFLPYLLFLEYRHKRNFSFIYYGYIFASAFILFLLLYTLIFKISLIDTYTSYNFHNLKSVGTESLWATFIVLFDYLSHISLPAIEGAYGINAISRNELPLPIYFFNYFWVIPVLILHIIYFLKNFRRTPEINYEFVLVNMLLFLSFSKVLSNQYFAWFLCMIPLIDLKLLSQRRWIINLFLITVSVVLHTYIYPLQYSAWLDLFNGDNHDVFLLWTGLISNLMLVVLIIKMTYEVLLDKAHQNE